MGNIKTKLKHNYTNNYLNMADNASKGDIPGVGPDKLGEGFSHDKEKFHVSARQNDSKDIDITQGQSGDSSATQPNMTSSVKTDQTGTTGDEHGRKGAHPSQVT